MNNPEIVKLVRIEATAHKDSATLPPPPPHPHTHPNLTWAGNLNTKYAK